MNNPVFFCLFTLLMLQGCASIGAKSNDAKLAKLAGTDWVISLPDKTLNLDQLTGDARKDQSIFRLVSEEDYRAAFISNGREISGNLSLSDPSLSIANSLNKYYRQHYGIQFIAKGKISSLDADYLTKGLKTGDYLMDVRVSNLSLKLSPDNSHFYLSGAYRLTVFDRRKGEHLIQDTCTFSEPNNSQTVRYFSQQNGLPVAQFLARYAKPCLQYFVFGKNENATTASKTKKKPQSTTQKRKPAISGGKAVDLGIAAATTLYPDYASADAFNSTQLSVTFLNPLSDGRYLLVRPTVSAMGVDAFPTFGDDTVYAAGLSVGLQWPSSLSNRLAYQLWLSGETTEFQQHDITISTNAIGPRIAAEVKLAEHIYAQSGYQLWWHFGSIEDANQLGHSFNLGLGYRFN